MVPMIVGTGVDIAEVDRIRESIERFGKRFLNRVFTEGEIQYCERKASRFESYAARFAAKEAAAKAMGTGFRDGLMLHHIGVTHDSVGKPQLAFTDQAAEFVQANNITSVHVSLADEEDHAVAFVTLATG